MDPIGNMLTQLRNAALAGKSSVLVPHSNLKQAIALLLEKEGYIGKVTKKGKKIKKYLEIELLYNGKKAKIQGASRVSKLSRRVYYKVHDIKPVRHGYGSLILSTPKGILTDREARKEKVGGEALFTIW